ncbi:MAG: valine--tRNA ligase [Oscillospiraceae bacterium]|jgi:valyl-tRNA synthetase|nr:valine--tRNA ligase [Oscillospiraceae bacterium]
MENQQAQPEPKTMEKTYTPQDIEAALYAEWESGGYFHCHRDPGKTPFTIVMPPPNITGQLHMGHALDCTVQDILTRYHRMKGEAALWLPGTDHASIATEVKIVEQMAEEGLTKETIGREGFLRRAWAWKERYGGHIVQQQRRLGASCDWDRERFTMDEGCSRAVVEVFNRLYEKGLIYRGDRIINWCPACRTALSDAEVEYEEQATHIWHIRYSGPDGDVVVATTRPETMLGDTGVAVHPDDPRYRHLVGKTVTLPLVGRAIPVVADDYVDMAFGTGAVKMTPAHDPHDFDIAQRHGLEILRVMDDAGVMNEAAGAAYAGLTGSDCRERVIGELRALGALVKVEDYTHNVGTCYRCHTTVEPLVSRQWFVKMGPLAAPAIAAVREGRTRFVPERFEKIYFNWMENIRDWCISRQLWWGHRIPAYYCDACGEMTVSRTAPAACPKCGGSVRQDEDVLDTWFSSALWPFSTLGWPEKTEDLRYFYPTSVLVTSYDIIFFWVARMIFSGIEQMGMPPFHTVVIHGLMRDALGRKMSKSAGNGVDPLEAVDTYGADALRFALTMGVSPGSDLRFSAEKAEAARNFANKVWNAARFVVMNLDGWEGLDGKTLSPADRWILTRYQQAVRDVTEHLERYDLGLAAQKVYDFAWSEFCDWYIELAKITLNGQDAQARRATQATLIHVLGGLLKLLHPIMPFLTDAVYRYLPGAKGSIMLTDWPQPFSVYDFAADAARMDGIMDIVRAVRNLRAEMRVPVGRKAQLWLLPQPGWEHALTGAEPLLQRLAWVSEMRVLQEAPAGEKLVAAVCPASQIYIPLGDLVDTAKELARLGKERDQLAQEIARAEGKLNNPGFTGKAPEALVQAERDKLTANQGMLETLDARIRDMQ